MYKQLLMYLLPFFPIILVAQNPIIPNKGINDPHIRIFNGKAYLAASHDRSIENEGFFMDDWRIYSSSNLTDWKLECVIKPENTYIGKPIDKCFAVDFIERNGKYYFYFSEYNKQIGVLVADSPAGPWKDPLGKPLIHADMTPRKEYDPGIVVDPEGNYYVVFGFLDYYIAKLNEDMISLAEMPKKIEIDKPNSAANRGMVDDKPYLHFHNGKYYLSWGCYYAMAHNVYGPYTYKGAIMDSTSFAEGYASPTWPNGFTQGRHGAFFEWHNQWYFTYCDISQTGNRYFRDSFISYVHYKENGEMAIVRVDGTGVGNYEANQGKIEAEDYFKAEGVAKKELEGNNFAIVDIDDGDYLVYPQIKGLSAKEQISFKVSGHNNAFIEIRKDSPKGDLLTKCKLKRGEEDCVCKLPQLGDEASLCFVFKFKGKDSDFLQLDAFSFY